MEANRSTNSLTMKVLRILTGQHAGTSIELPLSDALRISAESTSDLQIIDWDTEPLILNTHPSTDMNAATISFQHADRADAWLELVAQKFGHIVLCWGQSTAAWPSDFQLLENLLTPRTEELAADATPPTSNGSGNDSGEFSDTAPTTAPSIAEGQEHRRWYRWATAALVLSVVLVAVALHRLLSRLPAPIETPIAQRLQTAIQNSGVANVSLISTPEKFTIKGLVASTSEVQKLRTNLDSLSIELSEKSHPTLEWQLVVAEDIAHSLSDAIALPEVQVRHLQFGQFEVSGAAQDMARLKAISAKVVADLPPLGVTLSFDVEQLPPPVLMPVAAMLTSPGVDYVQTRDGTKHIHMSSTQPPPSSSSSHLPH